MDHGRKPKVRTNIIIRGTMPITRDKEPSKSVPTEYYMTNGVESRLKDQIQT